jgi:hypothetical protein
VRQRYRYPSVGVVLGSAACSAVCMVASVGLPVGSCVGFAVFGYVGATNVLLVAFVAASIIIAGECCEA